MRLEILDDRTRRFVQMLLMHLPASGPRLHRRRASPVRARPSTSTTRPNPVTLAQKLIEKQCVTHSLGLIYHFLLQNRGSPVLARAEFVRFLSGEWPDKWVEAARLSVKEQTGRAEADP